MSPWTVATRGFVHLVSALFGMSLYVGVGAQDFEEEYPYPWVPLGLQLPDPPKCPECPEELPYPHAPTDDELAYRDFFYDIQRCFECTVEYPYPLTPPETELLKREAEAHEK